MGSLPLRRHRIMDPSSSGDSRTFMATSTPTSPALTVWVKVSAWGTNFAGRNISRATNDKNMEYELYYVSNVQR